MTSIRRDAVRVAVPASSANLGPGFDSMALALAIYDDLIAMATDDEGLLVEVVGEGEGVVPLDETNLVAHSMLEAFGWLDVPVPGFILRCTNTIPHGRGLGSSASAIIGGIVLARAMVADGRDRMTDSDVLQLALRQESHPDNLSARTVSPMRFGWIRMSTSDPLFSCRRRRWRRRRHGHFCRGPCRSPMRPRTCLGPHSSFMR
ncbi:MAG: hypothetical protein NTX29_16715 [Actinobacteria bacterium]|nr:hypothetical protein [Actinomycetota bacterium]